MRERTHVKLTVANVISTHRATYKDLIDEAVVLNTLGATLLALMVVMPVLLLLDKFRVRPVQVIAVHGL